MNVFTINKFYNGQPGPKLEFWQNSDFNRMLDRATEMLGPFDNINDYNKIKKQLYDTREAVKWFGDTLVRVYIVSRSGFWGSLSLK